MDKNRPNHSLPTIFSQNYLKDKELIFYLIKQSNINSDDHVLEIGAGRGMITKCLLQTGCYVTAIELDVENCRILKNKFKGITNCNIVEGDFLSYHLPKSHYKIFANIPFFITAEILHKITSIYSAPDDSYLILQKQPAYKYCGLNCSTQISILLAPFFYMDIIHYFKRTDFKPVPRIDCVMLHIHKKESSDIEIKEWDTYQDFICYCFQNGKTFLKDIFTYKQIKRIKQEYGVTPEHTPGLIKYIQWLALFRCFLQFSNSDRKKHITGSYLKYLKNESRITKHHRGR